MDSDTILDNIWYNFNGMSSIHLSYKKCDLFSFFQYGILEHLINKYKMKKESLI